MTDDVADLFNKLAESAGVAAEHYWMVLVRQATIDGVSHLILAAAVVAAMIFIWRVVVTKLTDEIDECRKSNIFDQEYATVLQIFRIIAFIAIAILLVVSVDCIVTGTSYMINPGYYALQDLINQLEQLKPGT